MPRIPGYQQDLQRQTNAPIQVEDPRLARANADQVQNLAQSIGRFGQTMSALDQYEAAKQKEARNVELSNLGLEFRGLSDEISNKAYMEASPDGSDLVARYDSRFDKYATDRIAKIKDPLTQQQAYGEYLKVKVQQRDRLLGDSRKMFNENALKAYESRMNLGSTNVTTNPLRFDEEYGEYQRTILNSGLTPEAKMNALKLGQENMARGAVKGYIAAGEYEEAKAQLTTKFASVFEQPELEKLLIEIDNEKVKSIELSVKALDRDEKVFKEALEERKNKNFLSVYKKVTEANSLDPFDPGRGKSIEDLNVEIDNLVSQNELRFAESQHLKRMLNKEQSQDSAEVSLNLYSRLARGENLNKLRDDILKASASKNLSSQTAQSLLSKVQTEKEKRSRRASKGYSESKNPMFRESTKLIEDHFAYDITSGLNKGTLAEQEAETKKIFYNLYYENPKYKNNPLAAAREALKRTMPEYEAFKVPIVGEKEAIDNPNAVAAELKRKLGSNEISRDQYIKGMFALKQLQLKKQRERNAE